MQKLTLLDYPGHVACTVFTVGCNMRCPFCHNASLVTRNDEELKEEEFFDFLEKRKGLLDGVCVTGGEPLLQPDIKDFLKRIKSMGFKVKLDTNGSFPDRLEEILDEGPVDMVAMDLKNTFEKYPQTVGVEGFDCAAIKRSIELIKNSGIEHEFRTTVVGGLHDPGDFGEMARQIEGNYFLQKFVDSGDLVGDTKFEALSETDMNRALENAKKILPQTEIRG